MKNIPISKTILSTYIRTLIVLFAFGLISYSVSASEGTVKTITYQSTAQNTSCKMNIYLPAGYDEATDTNNSYPVFYLYHGGGENYTHWINLGETKSTLDSYISSGKAVPMIVVMPDCKNIAADVFTKELLTDIIPFIEKNYRVKKDKDHRGVGGLSWGGLQALDAGLYHYEMFGYVAILSSGWFATDQAAYSKAKDFLAINGKNIEKSTRYLYFSEGTSQDMAYANGQITLKLLKENGLTVHYWEHPGGHSWMAWKADLKAFAPYLFRDASTKYVSLDFQGGNISTATIMTKVNSSIAAPENPTRIGFTFSGWYKEPACSTKFNFSTEKIKQNTTLYAKWTSASN